MYSFTNASTIIAVWAKPLTQMDFGETYAPVGKLTTSRYLNPQVRKHYWNMDHLDVVTAFLNPAVDDNDIYMTLPEGWPNGLNTNTIFM